MSVPRYATRVARWLVAVLWLGCTQVDTVAVRPPDAALPGADLGTDFCEGTGPLVQVGDGPRCAGQVAQTTFRYAVCTCEGWATSAPVITDAFDSTAGPYTLGEGGGSVGTNGRFDAAASAAIGGGLDVGGAALVFGAVDLEVRGRLRSAGPLTGDGALTVGGDARVDGDLRVGDLTVAGAVITPPGATVEVRGVDAAPRREMAPVDVPAPCDCAPDRLLDVAAVVDAHRTDHDDAIAGLDPRSLVALPAGTRVELDCGRYYFERVDGADLTVRARGRVAIFVAGDLALNGALGVELDAGAEVDLFVAGNVLGQARWTLGGPEDPAAVRVYVGGDGTLELAGGALFAGNVYAPRAELVTPADVEVFGSLFARRLAASGPLTVHYDRAVLRQGAACPTQATCTSCRDCGNQACLEGTCDACRTDADCCAPLLCAAGTCVPQID